MFLDLSVGFIFHAIGFIVQKKLSFFSFALWEKFRMTTGGNAIWNQNSEIGFAHCTIMHEVNILNVEKGVHLSSNSALHNSNLNHHL